MKFIRITEKVKARGNCPDKAGTRRGGGEREESEEGRGREEPGPNT
jgi:hypothetical protein